MDPRDQILSPFQTVLNPFDGTVTHERGNNFKGSVPTMDARDTLLDFLQDLENHVVFMENTVEELVESNFDALDDKNMRLLIDRALKERDTNAAKGGKEADLLGSWGVIIDTIKTATLKRRDRAGNLLQLTVNTGVKAGPKELQSLLTTLKAQNQIDRVFVDLVNTSYEDCKSQGNEVLTDILKYTKTFLGVLQSKQKSTSAGSSSTKTSVAAATTATSASSTPSITKTGAVPSSGEKASSSGSSGKSPAKAPTSASTMEEVNPATDVEIEPGSTVDTESRMIRAGLLLQELLRTSAGDVLKLKTDVIQRCLVGEIDSLFLNVLDDNIRGCQEAGYVNKVKVLELMRGVIVTQLEAQSRQKADTNSFGGEHSDLDAAATMVTSTHHAPQFVDQPTAQGTKRARSEMDHIEVTLVAEAEKEFINAREASAALRGVTTDSKVNNKKKASKSSAKKQVSAMASAASEHLEKHGWAVLDDFLPKELVQRVRVESGLFRNSFEASEIWVGKQADVGAQLSVPSVRGDKVLWMCGGHSSAAPEGVSRTVRTIGEIEPCKLEVKKQAPIRRFAAMKELVGACDSLMESMKEVCPSLQGVYERSDAMLAVYPGEGARFAKHIDNSTGDGRRLTLLIYLNPGWKKEDGGALRLFPNDYRNGKAGTEDSQAQQEAVDVYPEGGRLAMFYSADIPHEVLPTFGDRHAITLWYYDQTERAQAVMKAKEGGTASKVATASVQSQQLAKVFIGELMGGDEVSEDGGEPTETELRTLASKVTQFSDEVIGVAAAITGAPSVQSFRTGFPLLSTQDLKAMRALFRRMGLGSYSVA